MTDKGKEEEYLDKRGEFDSKILLTYGRYLVF